jgi:hypothetical protein
MMTGLWIPEMGSHTVQPSIVPAVASRGTKPQVFETAWNRLKKVIDKHSQVCIILHIPTS